MVCNAALEIDRVDASTGELLSRTPLKVDLGGPVIAGAVAGGGDRGTFDPSDREGGPAIRSCGELSYSPNQEAIAGLDRYPRGDAVPAV